MNSHAALKTGGILLWDFGCRGNCANFLDVMQKQITENQYADYFEDFEMPWFLPAKEQYHGLISDVGYSDFTITEVNRDRYFPTADEMITWIDQPCIVPFLECIPDSLKSTFRREVIEAMLKKAQQPDGTCFETFRRLQIYARK